jgi:hypothetical protein
LQVAPAVMAGFAQSLCGAAKSLRRRLDDLDGDGSAAHPQRAAGQRRRLKRIAGHITNVPATLHHHHMTEDELLSPILHARQPMRTEHIHRVKTEHEFIAK